MADGSFARLGPCWSALLLIIAILLPSVQVQSAKSQVIGPQRYHWTIFSETNSDLPHDFVTALSSSPDGRLWIGTKGGLASLHEGQWRVSLTETGERLEIPVRALAVAADGAVWIGTFGGGVGRLHQGKFKVFKKENSKLPDDRVTSVAAAQDGAVWIGTEGGLVRLHHGQWGLFTRENSALPDNRVTTLVVAKAGAVWVGTGEGLVRLHRGKSEVFTEETTHLPSNAVLALAVEETDDAVWIGTREGLARLHHGQADVFTTENSDLPNNVVGALAVADDGAIWIGTSRTVSMQSMPGGGLARLHQGQWQVFTEQNSKLPDNGVVALTIDDDGGLWIGMERGLTRLYKSPWQVFTEQNSDLPYDLVSALAVTPDGGLWIGTGDGLARLNGEQWEVFNQGNSDLPNNAIRALATDAGGALWIGTQGGLAHLNQGQWQVFTEGNSGLPHKVVTALALTPDDGLWVGTQGGGLARLNQGQWQVFTPWNSELPNLGVSALVVAPDGGLWIGTQNGLARFHQGRWKKFLTDFSISALAIAPDDGLWAGLAHVVSKGLGLAYLQNGQWSLLYTKEDSDLPDNWVSTLAVDVDGAFWVGTGNPFPMRIGSGLARLHQGHWQVFDTDNSDIPDNSISSLAVAKNGALWIGTFGGGLARFALPQVRPIVADLVGRVDAPGARITQDRHTFAAIPFDPNYLTSLDKYRYHWRLERKGVVEPVTDRIGYNPYYVATLKDGRYRIEVSVLDIYGTRSEPYRHDFAVALPKEDLLIVTIKRWAAGLLGGGSVLSLLYILLLVPLVWLYPRYGLARSSVNSGGFSRFPLVHRLFLNSRWARRRLFRIQADRTEAQTTIPAPYIAQTIYRTGERKITPIGLDGSLETLDRLLSPSRRALVVARSGTGKSVLLRFLARESARRFRAGEDVPLPILLDLRTQPLQGQTVEAAIRDALKGGKVELPENILNFMIQKGGFLVLIDSLNEVKENAVRTALNPFLNRDADNRLLLASQIDMLERPDLPVYTLAEVTSEQARVYLRDVVGRDPWDKLPKTARSLARNPQDLHLLAGIVATLGPERVPTRRAELYREILLEDTALADWAAREGSAIRAIYALAFRMVDEQRVLAEDRLTEWVAEALEAVGSKDEEVTAIVETLKRSRLFVSETERTMLGRTRPVIGFRHELIGKFLASRHVRRGVRRAATAERGRLLELSAEDKWLDVFCFVVDEIDGSATLNALLTELLSLGGEVRLRIVAYAFGTKPEAMIEEAQRRAYAAARLRLDLQFTPAA